MGEAITILLSGMTEEGPLAAVTLITLEALTGDKREEARSIAHSLAADWTHTGQLTHGIGPECRSLREEAPRSYLAARTANSYNFYDFRQGLLFSDEIRFSSREAVPDWSKVYEALKMDDAAFVLEACGKPSVSLRTVDMPVLCS